MTTAAPPQEIVLEVRRRGRRPRYHRGGRTDAGVLIEPEACNLDQAGLDLRELDALPADLPRPRSQLCARCWAGSPELEAARRGR